MIYINNGRSTLYLLATLDTFRPTDVAMAHKFVLPPRVGLIPCV